MLCKNCKNFDTIPGMKWGICDLKRLSGEGPSGIVKGPDWTCNLKILTREEKDELQADN